MAGEGSAFPDSSPKMCLQQSPTAPVPNWGAGLWELDKQVAFFQSTENSESTVRDSQAPARKTGIFSERNTTWHLAAKTLILSETIDVCERVVSDGV